jgi:methylated-DNA-protein-cysteine methyltransferase related protein
MPCITSRRVGRATIARSVALTTRGAILAVVRRIPRGRVAAYGVVARLAGLPGHARQVGYALHALPHGSTVPWYRVVNARGEIVVRDAGAVPTLAPSRQRALLEAEGVGFDARGRVVMGRYGWEGGRKA